jgi:hypothetical protein
MCDRDGRMRARRRLSSENKRRSLQWQPHSLKCTRSEEHQSEGRGGPGRAAGTAGKPSIRSFLGACGDGS